LSNSDPRPASDRLQSVPLHLCQRWFQAVITHPTGVLAGLASEAAQDLLPLPEGGVDSVIRGSDSMSATRRMSIYAHAYHARLIESLGESFPALRRALGEKLFNGLAFDFLRAHPPRATTLDRLADHFVLHLEATRPDRPRDVSRGACPQACWPDLLIDLARLEWSIDRVFDGPGDEERPVLGVQDLRQIPPSEWPATRLRLLASLRSLAMRFPVSAYYGELRRAQVDAVVPPPAPALSFVAIFRRDWIVRRIELSALEFELLCCLQAGKTVEEGIRQATRGFEGSEQELGRAVHAAFELLAHQGLFAGLRA
jgi:hypothetical protein